MDDTTDIPTEGITTHTAITGTTIGTGVGLSASMGAPGIIAIGKRIIVRTAASLFFESTGTNSFY
jgi:hypothetical protein